MLPQVAPEVGAMINKSDRFPSAYLRITNDALFTDISEPPSLATAENRH
jgi:hypothetical protein